MLELVEGGRIARGSCEFVHAYPDPGTSLRDAIPIGAWKDGCLRLNAVQLCIFQAGEPAAGRIVVHTHYLGEETEYWEEENMLVLKGRQSRLSGKREIVFLRFGEGNAARDWKEIFIHVHNLEETFSITRFPITERFFCGCMFGNDFLSQLYWNYWLNALSILFDVAPILYDIAMTGDTSVSKYVGLVNNVFCIFALTAYYYLLQTPLINSFLKARKLCLIMCTLTVLELVVLSFFLFEDDATLTRLAVHRLGQFADIFALIMWLNGIYLCQWGIKLLSVKISPKGNQSA
uniref:Uncharacterized protein n=1 Tax=Mucochytrium quahogii TaxID=96639 RepID=A0A7S2RQP3_9STRA|mmetsp:Transcript_12362/g.20065  ORF Transcript_12362/g.20065 Transcript_12362/m.20065 type:complete len:290 (-) Transcript_12362:1079-1948(-)